MFSVKITGPMSLKSTVNLKRDCELSTTILVIQDVSLESRQIKKTSCLTFTYIQMYGTDNFMWKVVVKVVH